MSYFESESLTQWGYLVNTQNLPDLISISEFNALTGNKYAGDTRVSATIPSATSAIRNYCGWHIAPSLECVMVYNVHDLRDAFVGSDLLVQLPATFITCVKKIVLGAKYDADANEWTGDVINGTDFERYDFGVGDGLLRIYDANGLDRRAKILVHYEAGLPDKSIGAVKELAANLMTHSIASSHGINSESAGGVSISYSSAWAGGSSSVLNSDSKEVLSPYKVRGVY